VTAASWARLGLVLVGALVFQVGVVDQVAFLGMHADVMVLLAGAAGLLAGPARGAMVGFVVGLVADLVVTTPYGLSSLAFVLVGFGSGLVRLAPAARATRRVQVVLCVLAGTLGTLTYAVLGALVGQPGMLSRTGLDAVVVVSLGAVVLAWPALWAMRWVVQASAPASSALGFPSGGSAAS
jgi:cell shape-determining protein MreD